MLNGLVKKVNTDTFTVKTHEGEFDCKVRGKIRNQKINIVVGDKVLIDKFNCTIEEVLERDNLLLRPPVSNIDVALVVTSIVEPFINLTLLDKLISIITIENIEPVIVFTKLDKASKTELQSIKKLSKYYESIGIKVFNNKMIRKLKRYLKGKIVSVCGQTGAGKSTLINKFDKKLNLATNEISKSLGRGKHTTRIVELFELDKFYIVDTPGFSQIDINRFDNETIANSFLEFQNTECKYRNCKHINEVGCKIKERLENGEILKSRYDNYLQFIRGDN